MSSADDKSKDPRVDPWSIELALWYWDLIARRKLVADPETQKNLDDVKKRICKDSNAAADYQWLTDAGCDSDQLLWFLAMLAGEHVSPVMRGWFDHPGPQSLAQLTGLSPRKLSTLKKKLTHSADEVEMINYHFHFGTLLHTPRLNYFWRLPALLRGYVSLLELASEKIGRGTHAYHNFAKASLIAHVCQCTQRDCDRHVSSLIAAVTGHGTAYCEETHRNWRNQHSDLIASLLPTSNRETYAPRQQAGGPSRKEPRGRRKR